MTAELMFPQIMIVCVVHVANDHCLCITNLSTISECGYSYLVYCQLGVMWRGMTVSQ